MDFFGGEGEDVRLRGGGISPDTGAVRVCGGCDRYHRRGGMLS